jgi:hypothetical protein
MLAGITRTNKIYPKGSRMIRKGIDINKKLTKTQ